MTGPDNPKQIPVSVQQKKCDVTYKPHPSPGKIIYCTPCVLAAGRGAVQAIKEL